MYDFFEWTKSDPERTAVVVESSGQRYSRREIAQSAELTAQWLVAQGLEAGDRFAVLLENRVEFLEIGLAARLAGLYMVPVNTHLLPDDVRYILTNSDSRLVIASTKTWPLLDKAGDSLAIPCWAVDASKVAVQSMASGLTSLSRSEYVDLSRRPVGRELIYTSGTTGRPKGVLLEMRPAESRKTPTKADLTLVELLGLDATTVYLHPAPLYHSAPLRYALRVMDFGGKVILMDRFDPEASLATIERFGVTHSQWVPTMFRRMLSLPPEIRNAYDLSSHRVAIHAAAPCPVPVKQAMLDWWGDIVIEYYAGSEQQGTTLITAEEWRKRPGSVGRAIIGRVHIVDENDMAVAAGVIGSVYFSGGSEFLYLGDPEKTRLARNRHGWGSYGDLGHVDEDGYLFLSDRRADLIISGGVNLYPQEIENVLRLSPDVEDVAIVGVADVDLGEAPFAIVVAANHRDNEASIAARIAEFAKSRLTRLQTPRGIAFVESLPRSEAGKLLRRILKENYRKGAGVPMSVPRESATASRTRVI